MPPPLKVLIKREPFSEMFDLYVEDPYSKQLSLTSPTQSLTPDETRDWFRARGGDVDKLEDVLDYCWNFPKFRTVIIANPRPVKRSPVDPKLEALDHVLTESDPPA